MITNDIIISYLYCNYQSYLKQTGQKGIISNYENYYLEQAQKIRTVYLQKITSTNRTLKYADNLSNEIPLNNYDFIIGWKYHREDIEIFIDALEITINKGFKVLSPIVIFPIEKISTREKVIVSCYYYLINKSKLPFADYCRIIYGENLKTTKIYPVNYLKKARNAISWLKSNKEPKVLLNQHCNVCEFHAFCKLKATEKDCLSQFSGISKKEILKWNNKGIFTIHQLSYNYRPRKSRKENKLRPHRYELRALALREKIIYIIDKPELTYKETQIYIDFESLPDEDFVYLIGLLIVKNSKKTFYSFWADTKSQEFDIFQKFILQIKSYENYTVFHYGNYEISNLKRIQKQMSVEYQKIIDNIIENSINLLVFFHSQIYLPLYSNKLKEIGKYLGFEWSSFDASGISSIIWRKNWELNKSVNFKEKIENYNHEDCLVLPVINHFLLSLIQNKSYQKYKVQNTSEIKNPIFHGKPFTSSELEKINKCSYFSYQREKVFLRTDSNIKHITHRKKNRKKKFRINKYVCLKAYECPHCKSRNIRKHKKFKKRIIDLYFAESGVKRWVTEISTDRYDCLNCNKSFNPKKYNAIQNKYGSNLMSWVVYQNISNNQSFSQISENLFELFQIDIYPARLQEFKKCIADKYKWTFSRIKNKLLTGDVIYADETHFKLKDEKGYVWVFSNNNEAICFYQSNREGKYLKEFLVNFKGILVSDFYAAYDSIKCTQQKCLIHLIRDLDYDLLKNPFDSEYKELLGQFTLLIQKIIITVDKYGLKKYYLKKHKIEVEAFYNYIENRNFNSEIVIGYQKRILKNRNKLFTFLNYDNVAWNNTNAEHAIKILAVNRNRKMNYLNKNNIEDFMVLFSIFITCKYNEYSFLKFLISGKKDIYKLLD
jgi:predicted RecB family nuclease